jgi:hypothetical protein
MTQRLSRLLVIVLGVGLMAGAGQPPQDQKQKDKQGKDPQAEYEPRSNPGVGQEFLKKFVGDWEVEKSFFGRGGGAPSKTKGECKQTMQHGDRFLKSEFTFGQGASQTTGTGTIGFDAQSGLFTSYWIDSRSTRISIRQSKDKFDGQKIVLFAVPLGQTGGAESARSRTITTLEDNGRKIVHRQSTINPDNTERPVMDLIMTRKTAATPPSH